MREEGSAQQVKTIHTLWHLKKPPTADMLHCEVHGIQCGDPCRHAHGTRPSKAPDAAAALATWSMLPWQQQHLGDKVTLKFTLWQL
jgi:hypothetical protein